MSAQGTKEIRHQIGRCPGCRSGVWTDVLIETTISTPYLSADGKAVASASASITRVQITHDCEATE